MNTVSEFIKRSSERVGFKREFFIEKNMPTQPSNIYIIPFFGDLVSTFIFSSLIFSNLKKHNPEKYYILCSWPGMRNFFPEADEYWIIEDSHSIESLASSADYFSNKSTLYSEITRSLAELFGIITMSDILKYYNKGFTKKYFDEFKEILKFIPEIPSSSLISDSFKNQLAQKSGTKIIIYPCKKIKSWQNGSSCYLNVNKDFWISVIDLFLEKGYYPVLYQNWFTFDMSKDFTDKCLYLVPKNTLDLLAAFKEIGLLLDIHSGISCFAIAARCPFIAVKERQIYIKEKDYEIDDIFGKFIPKQYLFSFATQILTGNLGDWKISFLDGLFVKIHNLINNKENYQSETKQIKENVSYNVVRNRSARRFGSFFINKSKNK